MNTITTVRPASALVAYVQLLHIRWIAFIAIFFAFLANNVATAQATPQALQNELDGKASTFCSYVNILPNSKWVKLGALIFFLMGLGLLLFGGRNGNTFLMRALGIIVILPSAVAIAKAFGIVC